MSWNKKAVILNLLLNLVLVGHSNAGFSLATDYCDLEKGCSSTTKSYMLSNGCYRAAVYEHSRIDESDMIDSVRKNLDIYNEVIKLAADNGANIIVLPEDGIFWNREREPVKSVLEEISDPETLSRDFDNPCVHRSKFETQPILSNLSCAARHNHIYVVANFGTKKTCEPGSQIGVNSTCPKSGFSMFNTNVVLDSSGRFIKRYYKYNTYAEIFDQAPGAERVYFDTAFGRFGTFTCFDILFKDPSVNLVEKDNVDTIVFPTWWYDEVPLLTSIQFQDAWSSTIKANFLASNILRRQIGSTGSGIYSKHSKAYTSAAVETPTLLIRDLPVKYNSDARCSEESQMIEINKGQTTLAYNSLHMKLSETDKIQPLDRSKNSMQVCNGKLCCQLNYVLSGVEVSDAFDKVVVFVRNSLRPSGFQWYEQICALVTFNEPWTQEFRGVTYSDTGLANFSLLQFSVDNFDTRYVFPIAAHSVTKLVERSQARLSCALKSLDSEQTSCELSISPDSEPIYAAGLYARVYERDNVVRIPHEP